MCHSMSNFFPVWIGGKKKVINIKIIISLDSSFFLVKMYLLIRVSELKSIFLDCGNFSLLYFSFLFVAVFICLVWSWYHCKCLSEYINHHPEKHLSGQFPQNNEFLWSTIDLFIYYYYYSSKLFRPGTNAIFVLACIILKYD